jgi:hypothetical protein
VLFRDECVLLQAGPLDTDGPSVTVPYVAFVKHFTSTA